MSIEIEPVTWEIVDYWKASGLLFGHVRPVPFFVSRDDEGKVQGVLGLLDTPEIRTIIIGPLIAKNGTIGLSLIGAMEKILASYGMYRYSFYIDKYTPEHWSNRVRSFTDKGIFEYLGISETGAHWYERHMVPLEEMVML